MQNYHRHSCYSNIFTADSSTTNEDYAKRAVELGHKIISSVEHGWQGYYFESFELAKKYNLKFVFGTEAYWVKDRHEKDRTNGHIIILAKNENGRQAINDILSTASEDGYYFKPRVDLELLLSLPPDDVFITTACVAFWQYEDIEEIVIKLHNYFKENFMLEIQYHNTEQQIDLNKKILYLADKYDIEMIVGLDSHYIYPEEAIEREYVLESKNIHYDNEDGWYMDYPDDKTIFQRFKEQNIFTDEQIQKAMDNTDICLSFEDYDDIPIFNKEIKLPTLYPNLSQEEKNKLYSRLITKKFKEYMKNVPSERYQEYFDGVKMEVQTYKDTGMVDYPLLDYEIVKEALKMGGLITSTGRGSAVGYFTNTLCGFSKVDRFTSAIKLYPERFISTTRILETKSLPDIDLNVGTPEIFEQAQINVLGQEHVYPMIAFGTFKKKSAFKLYARAKNLDFSIANEISSQIEKYEEAYKYADDDVKDEIDIYDYIDEKYRSYIEASSKYLGIISDKKKAPCSYLLYQGDIRREIGLIKCKSESTKKECITCVIDGAIAENYKFLKNDILKVDVVLSINRLFDRINISPFDINTLIKNVENDDRIWDLYAKGYTVGLNQVERKKDNSKNPFGTVNKVKKYKPKNVSELTAFIAAIRPGFASMYSKFESREDFSWGIPTLDNLIRTKELPVSFLFFQEQVMSVLNYAGFPMDECYGIIKAIAKKHPEKVKPLKTRFIEGFRKRLIKDEKISEEIAQSNSEKVWQIVNDNCGYGFNCVSGSTLLLKGAKNDCFNPTIEEMYKIRNSLQYAKKTGHLALRKKYRQFGYGMALSMFPDNKIRPNRIVSIKESGIRNTYLIKTEMGGSIICTDNHKFPTPYGEKELKDLKNGDVIYHIGKYKHKYFDSSLTNRNYEKNIPHKGQMGFQKNPNGDSVIYKNAINNYINKKEPCSICGKPYSNNERFELHHKDFDRHNNSNENYQWLCCSCHKKIHYANGRKKRYENGIDVLLDKIVSIKYYKKEMTYDIEMDDPAHNFVTDNGLIASNSAHAYCMALDSLYSAWQKVNYPYEFYEVMLNHYTQKGNKEKVAWFKEEMKKAFGINEGKYKWGLDNRQFVADKINHCINPSLVGIKGIGQNVANLLYKSSQSRKYSNLYEIFLNIKVSSDIFDKLIKINYFEDFGSVKKVLNYKKAFDELNGRKQFNKKDVAGNKYIKYIVNNTEETETLYRKFNSEQALNEIWNDLQEEDLSLTEKLCIETEYLGYPRSVISSISPNYAFVQTIKGNASRTVQLYRLSDGSTESIKVRKKAYDSNPFKEGQIIKTINCAYDKKWKYDKALEDKTGNGYYQIDEKEPILMKWSIVEDD